MCFWEDPAHRHPGNDGHAAASGSSRIRRWVVALLLVTLPGPLAAYAQAQAQAQESAGTETARQTAAEDRPFRLYRWQEDYSYLAGKPRNDWESLKYIPLPGLPNSWLSLGGEVRYRLDAYDPYLFGLGKSGYNWASNQERIFQSFDLHLGSMFRGFVQFDAAKEDGRPVQRAYDQSTPDLRQAFLDFTLPTTSGRSMIRGGRQELFLGESRWLAVRDPTNLRRSFEGFLGEYDDPSLTLRAFAAHPVNILPEAFDDNRLNTEYFRGGYATIRKPFDVPVTIDAYVYAREQASVTYARGTAAEDRWSGGARLAARFAGFEATAEATRQWGSFGKAQIDALGAFADLGYRFSPLAAADGTMTPKIGMRAHYASGDDNLKSGTLHNFTAAYPAASIISEMSLLSASNTTNIQPYVQVSTGPRGPILGANWNVVSRVSVADSVYGPIGTLITAKNSTSRDVAQIGQVDLTWDISKFLQLHALYAHIFAGQYIRDAGGRDFDYYRLQIVARW